MACWIKGRKRRFWGNELWTWGSHSHSGYLHTLLLKSEAQRSQACHSQMVLMPAPLPSPCAWRSSGHQVPVPGGPRPTLCPALLTSSFTQTRFVMSPKFGKAKLEVQSRRTGGVYRGDRSRRLAEPASFQLKQKPQPSGTLHPKLVLTDVCSGAPVA